MLPASIKDKRILLSTLNWGYGHLSRCIPIIQILLKNNNTLFYAGRESDFVVLQEYFSNSITYLKHAPYPFQFGDDGFRLIRLVPTIGILFKRYKQELKSVTQLVEQHEINWVLSDHRYGFRTGNCPSIFITHQCYLPLPKIAWPIQALHQFFMKKFNFVWIVDDEKINLAGKLARTRHVNSIYIGLQSRFEEQVNTIDVIKDIECILLISGPIEFSEALINHFRGAFHAIQGEKYLIGSIECMAIIPEDFLVYFKLNTSWKTNDALLLRAKLIMSYCGYSTLMDTSFLKCQTMLIPTKGQGEQEYLASIKKAPVIDEGFKI